MEENNTSTDKNTLTALIDYENCGSLKNISLEQYGELIIFVGPQQNVVVLPADSFPEGARITIRQVSGVSRNNVDFHLVLELGRISCCAAGKDKTYHIISSDKGYDGVYQDAEKVERAVFTGGCTTLEGMRDLIKSQPVYEIQYYGKTFRMERGSGTA
ncbi:traD_4 (plasmid) [Escherichia coli]|nr:traD_4 [Escherichia coli]